MITAVNQNIWFQVDRWAHRLLRWCAPAPCLVCREPGAAHSPFEGLCTQCQGGLPWNTQPITPPKHIAQIHAACVYAMPINRLLPRFKFHHDLVAGRLLMHLMLHALRATPRPDALVAVPLHPSRLRRRGYDQALELARPLARVLQLPLLTTGLSRARATSPQSELDASARKRNLKDAFTVRPGNWPQHIALIDDVMTTGATLNAAASTLRKAGVRQVDAWVCAWVP